MDEESNEKRLRRLAKNRDSARECRKRKRNRYEMLNNELVHLEAENLQLRMKLKIGPEATNAENDEALQMTNHLDLLLKQNASDEEIRNAIIQFHEKYSDYGRDRKGAIAFHIAALRRCLQPTQTTRTILWLMSCVSQFHEPDGTVISNRTGLIADLWYSLIRTIQPTEGQNFNLVALSGSCFMSTEFPQLQETALYTESIINRLETLVANKNESLDSEMKKLQSLCTVKQVAKFVLWIAKNPACMQMLEALWPHLTSQLASNEQIADDVRQSRRTLSTGSSSSSSSPPTTNGTSNSSSSSSSNVAIEQYQEGSQSYDNASPRNQNQNQNAWVFADSQASTNAPTSNYTSNGSIGMPVSAAGLSNQYSKSY